MEDVEGVVADLQKAKTDCNMVVLGAEE